MSAAPLIRTLQLQGGSFYAFSSASKDLTKAFNNTNIKLEFSKFVALDIPFIKALDPNTGSHFENYVQFNTIDGAILNGMSGDYNINISESLQNYALNLETLILSDSNYDSSIKRSVAERIFFKWLKETGAIRFRDANSTSEKSATAPTKVFVEEDEAQTGSPRYTKVVQYIGDIDIINSVEKAGENYTEIYLYIPVTVGNTPVVLFNTVSDNNYKPDLVITGPDEYIYGRNSSTIHPEGLSTFAFYDYDISVAYTDPNADWHTPIDIVNSYYTERTTFEDPNNIDIKKYLLDFPSATNFNGVYYRRSKLDGISIDLTPSDYYDIAADPAITTIQQYNSHSKSQNFSFNTILLYYDLYDVSNPAAKVTNLYGVLFLDNVTPAADYGYIDSYEKYKPNEITKLNGNSYGLSLNLKIDASVSDSGTDTIINEYNTFSMSLFSDAMVRLQEGTKRMIDVYDSVLDMDTKISDIENLFYSMDSLDTINQKLVELEQSINNAQLNYSSNTSLLDLIAVNSDNIQKLLNGQVSLALQYNTDVLQGSTGILLDKSVPNRIIVKNNVQEYNNVLLTDAGGSVITSTSKYNLAVLTPKLYFKLKEYTNMCRIYTVNTALNKLCIYIDDSAVRFSNGQTVRFVFPEILDMNNYSIEIYTDKNNVFGFQSYGKLIGLFTYSEMLTTKPILELICNDSQTYSFSLDVIR